MVPFGPLLAAVIAAALTGGLRGLGRLVAQLGRWPSSPRWYLIALLVPVLITGLAAGLTVALGGSPTACHLDPAREQSSPPSSPPWCSSGCSRRSAGAATPSLACSRRWPACTRPCCSA